MKKLLVLALLVATLSACGTTDQTAEIEALEARVAALENDVETLYANNDVFVEAITVQVEDALNENRESILALRDAGLLMVEWVETVEARLGAAGKHLDLFIEHLELHN